MPTISIIVPVYKVEPYLHRCVDSILNQTFPDFELILVDDGSPDNCLAICDEYARKDNRIHVIHQENGGLSAARNTGIDWAFAKSDSQWLTFVDSDDWIHPEMLERLLNAALENEVSVSICGYAETEGEEPEIDVEDMKPTVWTPEDFFVEHNVNAVVAWGKLYRRECFKEIRYPVGKLHEDEFTTYKSLFAYTKVAVIHAPLYFYYYNSKSITHAKWTPAKMNDAYTALEEQIQYFSSHEYVSITHFLMRRYVLSICTKTRELSKDKDAVRFLRKKKREQAHFGKYIKQLDINDPTDAWVLTKAFPICMKAYLHMRALLHKLGITTYL